MAKSKKHKTYIPKNKSISLISPLHFTNRSLFFYMVKNITFFYKYANDFNDFKPDNDDINALHAKINDTTIDNKDNEHLPLNISITPFFMDKIKSLRPVPHFFNEVNSNIIRIIEEISPLSSISIQKIIQSYKRKYKVLLSQTTVHRKLRNKLKYSYKKTAIKPIDLNKPLYKKMSFVFLKIILRAVKLNFNIIYIDESNFRIKQPNFKTWIKYGDQANIGSKKNGKINFLLALSAHKVINYKFTKLNTDTKLFKNFFIETILKLDDNEKKNSLFVMDNHVSHIGKQITDLVLKYKLKILYCVPYESCFNAIELSFRFIKNKIYKNIYFNIKSIESDVKLIINSDKFEKSLYKNYLETLRTYLFYINKNKEFDMNMN